MPSVGLDGWGLQLAGRDIACGGGVPLHYTPPSCFNGGAMDALLPSLLCRPACLSSHPCGPCSYMEPGK